MDKQPCVRAAGLLLGALLIVACSKQPASEPLRSAADDTAVEHALKHTNPQYRCPMHPDVVRDEPGNCPICGMTLVRIESPAGPGTPSSSASRAEIRISPAVVNNLGVRTEVVQRGGLARRGEVVGYVGFDERRVQQVRPRADGWVEGLVGPCDGRNGAAGSTAVHAVFADARKRAAGVPRRAANRQRRT